MKFNFRKIMSTAFALVLAVSAVSFDKAAAIKADALDVSTATASQILGDMGIGWNLGNTLDSTGGNQNNLNTETSWGNPKTTQQLIDAVKDAGFNTVRVPVSWGKHVKGSDYTIDKEWLARVEEIINYCYNDDMYVILNIHHDNAKAGTANTYYPDSANKANAEKFVKSIWSQVADYFKDYDHHLIFETLNEPRLIGTNSEWWFNVNNPGSTVSDSISVINTLNQDAVNEIRATGSNNSDRLVMCPGYGASLDGATTSGYKLPTDVSGNTNRLVVSVHAYSPYNFAMNVGSGSTSTFSSSMKTELDSIFNTIKTKFTSKGIPVIIGEMGATNKDNAQQRYAWADYYTQKAKEQNIVCCIWDNNYYGAGETSSENFGAINRSTNKPYDAEYIKHLTALYVKHEPVDIAGCSATLSQTSYDYDGSEKKPAVSVINGTKTLAEGTDYTLSYTNNVNVGTATVTITGMGDYTGTIVKNFEIIVYDYDIANASIGSVMSQSYLSGMEITPLVSVRLNNKNLLKGRDYTVSYKNNTQIGTATMTITGKGKYTGSKSTEFTIKERSSTTVKKPTIIARQTTPYAAVVVTIPDLTVNGSEVMYSYNKDFTSSKTISKEGYGLNVFDITSIKGDKVYGYDNSKVIYAKVRSFIYVDGKKTYGDWSDARTINALK